jgi:hypothetical protein
MTIKELLLAYKDEMVHYHVIPTFIVSLKRNIFQQPWQLILQEMEALLDVEHPSRENYFIAIPENTTTYIHQKSVENLFSWCHEGSQVTKNVNFAY